MNPEPRDVRSLVQQIRAGSRPSFVFFWGHTSASDHVGKECLSQWYPAPFVVEGVTYATAEHYMMAEKARLFGDEDVAHAILAAPHPSVAKDLGRKVRGFDGKVWERHRFEVVVRGNDAKFAQNAPLGEYLRQTGDSVLVEASPTDAVWGMGLAADDPRAKEPASWRGLNLLGFALMDVRARLTTP